MCFRPIGYGKLGELEPGNDEFTIFSVCRKSFARVQ